VAEAHREDEIVGPVANDRDTVAPVRQDRGEARETGQMETDGPDDATVAREGAQPVVEAHRRQGAAGQAGMIRIYCLCCAGLEREFKHFEANMKDVVSKTTKAALIAEILPPAIVPADQQQMEGCLQAVRAARPDVVVLVDDQDLPRPLVNAVMNAMNETGVQFHVISKSNLRKKFVYVDIVVELLLRKRKIVG